MQYTIQGTLTTTSPLHIARPGSSSVDELGRSTERGFPCTRVQRMALGKSIDSEANNGFAIPVIPANSFRGRLRRTAADCIKKVLIEKGEKLSLGAYHAITCGAVTGQPDGVLPTVDEIQKTSRHPFIGLFGGGPRMLRSHFRVDTGWPIVESTLGWIVPDVYAPRQTITKDFGMTRVIFFRRMDDALQFHDPYAGTIIQDYARSIDEWQELVGRRPDPETGADDAPTTKAKKISLQGFSALEIVIPGVTFFFRAEVDTRYVGNAGLGLFLQALEDLANQQALGGWCRNGFGRFALDLSLASGQNSHNLLIHENGRYSVDDTNEEALAAMDAWAEATASISAGEIEELLKPAADKKSQSAKKKKPQKA